MDLDFLNVIREHKNHVISQIDLLKDKTEEATKTSLVNPFIRLLGYEVNNLNEVEPEFIADVGVKKGEKVDYAIKIDGKPIMIFECKSCGADIEKPFSQLFRYFTVTKTRIGVLTDGVIYRFYSDLDEKNKMDQLPFFEFNILEHSEDEKQIDELKRFTKKVFNTDEVNKRASTLKYTNQIKDILKDELESPSTEFVNFFLGKVMPGKVKTSKLRDEFSVPLKRALNKYFDDRVREILNEALMKDSEQVSEEKQESITEEKLPKATIITTEDEWAGFGIVKAILNGTVDSARVTIRDVQTYCNILLDNNIRKRICLFYMNNPENMSLVLFDSENKENKVKINSVDDIFNYSEKIIERVKSLIS